MFRVLGISKHSSVPTITQLHTNFGGDEARVLTSTEDLEKPKRKVFIFESKGPLEDDKFYLFCKENALLLDEENKVILFKVHPWSYYIGEEGVWDQEHFSTVRVLGGMLYKETVYLMLDCLYENDEGDLLSKLACNVWYPLAQQKEQLPSLLQINCNIVSQMSCPFAQMPLDSEITPEACPGQMFLKNASYYFTLHIRDEKFVIGVGSYLHFGWKGRNHAISAVAPYVLLDTTEVDIITEEGLASTEKRAVMTFDFEKIGAVAR